MPGLLDDPASTEGEARLPPSGKPSSTDGGGPYTTLPSGVVLDKNGKPCRTCTSSAAWKSMMKSSTAFAKTPVLRQDTTPARTRTEAQSSPPPSSSSSSSPPALQAESTDASAGCPPDVEELGRSSWTLLHALTASYPPTPEPSYQAKTRSFLQLFSQLYPCWVCAEDFQTWMSEPANEVAEALKSQEEFGQWMCRAHNAVNVKLGKKQFDCGLWRQRWKDGFSDGRCD